MLPLYERAIDSTGAIIAGTKESQFDKPTPCAKFDVRKVLEHVIGGNYMFVEVCNGRTVDPSAAPADLIGADASASYQQSAKLAFEAWSTPGLLEKKLVFPFGEMPGMGGLALAIIETLTHGWDLATATGQKTEIDPDLATVALQFAKMGINDEIRSRENAPFGPEVQVPETASPTEKLVAFLGRKP